MWGVSWVSIFNKYIAKIAWYVNSKKFHFCLLGFYLYEYKKAFCFQPYIFFNKYLISTHSKPVHELKKIVIIKEVFPVEKSQGSQRYDRGSHRDLGLWEFMNSRLTTREHVWDQPRLSACLWQLCTLASLWGGRGGTPSSVTKNSPWYLSFWEPISHGGLSCPASKQG